MAEELKACPFCGGTKIKKNSDDGQFWSTCQQCFADGPPTSKRSDEGAPDWNTRAQLASQGGEENADPVGEVMALDDGLGTKLTVWNDAGKDLPVGTKLYTHPAGPGAVAVPIGILRVACGGGNEAWQALEEIRALLEMKP